ncbi:patatin-like phospholipase family protein [Verrucomicrobiales bacterium BCK34]|nr:patatin-like phospholipase family protein [Verrucomicrobiales bacterium BCK34]
MAALLHFFRFSRCNEENSKPEPDKDRPRIGIALSSGGARGLAHIGVIQVLEENHIPIDAIVGTSMGAYVGGLWASGLSGAELEVLASKIPAKRDLWKLVDPVFPPRKGFIRGRAIHGRLDTTLDGKEFSDLKTPFLAVATELDSLKRALLGDGEVSSAILASLAVPGVVVPVERNGIEYIDGGVCDPFPVRLAREHFDLDYVIGVNVLPPVGALKVRRNHRENPGWLRRGLRWLNQHINYFARGNLLDILRNAAMGSQMRLVDRSAVAADVYIPAISNTAGWHDYHRYRDYIKIGREAAEAALPEIRKLLSVPVESAGDLNPNMEELTCV